MFTTPRVIRSVVSTVLGPDLHKYVKKCMAESVKSTSKVLDIHRGKWIQNHVENKYNINPVLSFSMEITLELIQVNSPVCCLIMIISRGR